MQKVMERQKVVDEYRSMMVDGMDLTPLELNSCKSDLVVISHIICIIEVLLDNIWHYKTFEVVLADLWRSQDEEIHEQENEVLHCTENDETNRKLDEKNTKELAYTNIGSYERGKWAEQQIIKNPRMITKSQEIKKNEKALVTKEMTLSNLGKNIFVGDSAATSHMTSNKMGVYNLIPIKGSVMIANGQSIICTHKGKLDVIYKHKDGSMAKETWDVKILRQLNHDLFSFARAMKEGWQMNGRWKEGGLIIELFKTTRPSMKFDRMIPSGSSLLMGVKIQRVIDQPHAVIEPGKKISMWKFHQITGHTVEHLLSLTAKYMKIELTGKLPPCEICAQAKIRQANVPKKKMKKVPSRPGYRVYIDISSFKHESKVGKRHWLIAVDEFSDCIHSFFPTRKSDQIAMI